MTNKEAIEELRELIEIDLHPCPPIYEEALNLAIKALERSIGRWEVRVNDLNKSRTIHCSICDYHFPSWQDKSNFCPSCGARMEVEND